MATQTAPTRELPTSSQGAGLVGLVLAGVILGAMAALALSLLGSGGGHDNSVALSPTQTLSAAPSGAAADLAGTAAATCRADYQAVATALADYQALNGKPAMSMAALQSFFKEPVTSTRFIITLDPHHAGQIDVTAGQHSAQAGDRNCAYAG